MSMDGIKFPMAERGKRGTLPFPSERVGFPDDPQITALMAKTMCLGRLGENGYVVKNMYDDERFIPFGAPFSEWEKQTGVLFDLAIWKSLAP